MDALTILRHGSAMELSGKPTTILGGGIAGLAVARALALRGADITVLEQAEALGEVGAGLQISPNGARVLRALGLGDAMERLGLRAEAVELYDYKGARVVRLPLGGADYFFLHRADLIDILAQSVRASGVQMRLLQRIEKVELKPDAVKMTTSQGAPHSAKFLIGADGLHSKVREALNGRVTPFFTRQVAWRAVVPAHPEVPPVARVWMGPGRHLVSYPLRGGALQNIVAVEERDLWVNEGWHHEDDPENLRTAFQDFAPEVQDLLARVETVNIWGLFRHPVARHWQNGTTAILGDAAHPTLPFLAQGANLALEDAWVLAASLDQHPSRAEALTAYQAQRLPRVTKVIEAANRNARNYHLRQPFLRLGAHTALRLAGLVPGLMLGRLNWIYKHDVTALAGRSPAI